MRTLAAMLVPDSARGEALGSPRRGPLMTAFCIVKVRLNQIELFLSILQRRLGSPMRWLCDARGMTAR
jgi:hypothetical protein